eukprot:10683713-Alexandrium_andersonii.AAC.1
MVCVCVCARARVRALVRACERARERAFVLACVRAQCSPYRCLPGTCASLAFHVHGLECR